MPATSQKKWHRPTLTEWQWRGVFFSLSVEDQPASLSAGTPKLLELSLIKASVEFVKVWGESVRSGPLEESNRSNVAVTASVPPEIEQNRWLVRVARVVTYVNKVFRPFRTVAIFLLCFFVWGGYLLCVVTKLMKQPRNRSLADL